MLEISGSILKGDIHSQQNLDSIQADPIFAKRFINYLFTVHTMIRASVPLMHVAYKKCLQLEHDPLVSSLLLYYETHIEEERDHDEWLLDDFEVIGIPRREILSRRPSLAVAELVGSQYYWTYHWHPVSLLGYIAVMEGYPPKKEDIIYLQKRTGFSDKAFRTLSKHSFLDPRHRDDMNDLLNSLPLNPDQEEWITLNALYTADRVREIIKY